MAYTPSGDFSFTSGSYTPSGDFSFASTYLAAVETGVDTLEAVAKNLVQSFIALSDSPDVFYGVIIKGRIASCDLLEVGTDTYAGTGHIGWHLVANLTETGIDSFQGTGVIPHILVASLLEPGVDGLSCITRVIASTTAELAEIGNDTGSFAAVHTFHATLTAVESGLDIGSFEAQNLVTGRLTAFELVKDGFSGLSTHALNVYAPLLEVPDIFAAAGVVPKNCYMAATESASDRFFCYTAGIFPLHAPRGYLITLPSRSYYAQIL